MHSSGKVRFVNRAGRIDKTFEAHKGAVADLRWNTDGSALLTGKCGIAVLGSGGFSHCVLCSGGGRRAESVVARRNAAINSRPAEYVNTCIWTIFLI